MTGHFLSLLLCALSCFSEGTQLTIPSLNISEYSKGTHSITVSWNLTDPNSTIELWRVTVEDLSKNFIASYDGPANIDLSTQLATVIVHQADTSYSVCLVAFLTESASSKLNISSVQDCKVYSTIPLLLKSSLIPLVVVILSFVFLVLLGGISYKVKQFSIAGHQYRKAEEMEAEPDSAHNGGFSTNHKANHIEA